MGPGVPDAQRQPHLKSVLSGTGYKEGEKVTVAASRKGRIWSHGESESISSPNGAKILARSFSRRINPDEVLAGTLERKPFSCARRRCPSASIGRRRSTRRLKVSGRS